MRYSVAQRARRVKLLVFDVDGVLSDGQMIVGDDGVQVKSFDVRDGFALVWARRCGLRTAIITAERSATVTHRAKRLGIEWVAQFARDKAKAFKECCGHFGVPTDQICYVGDDLPDLPVLRRVGLAVAVPDAPSEVKAHAHYITKKAGGRGAAREVVELILRAQGRWEAVVREYLT